MSPAARGPRQAVQSATQRKAGGTGHESRRARALSSITPSDERREPTRGADRAAAPLAWGQDSGDEAGTQLTLPMRAACVSIPRRL